MPQLVPTYRPSFLPTKQERGKQYNRTTRNPESTRFYHSRAWILLRDIKFSNSPYCECPECIRNRLHVPATHVHHIKPITTHPHLALDEGNLMSMSNACHSRLHASRSIII
jgi:5-methylcytosine-specific restriction endonuclease McrA